LNFIRYSCRDSDWIETQAKLANAGRGKLAFPKVPRIKLIRSFEI
jgi:hypothetical protein